MTDTDSNQRPVSERLPVSVLTSYRESREGAWDTGAWDVIGVVAGQGGGQPGGRQTLVREDRGEKQYLWTGCHLDLFKDAAEGCYHNLMSENPRIFVVCQQEDGGPIEPYLVTVNYDEAAAHMEMEEEVFSVPLPPELYRFVEHFVLAHYVPEKRKKRKREDWKSQPHPDHDPRSR